MLNQHIKYHTNYLAKSKASKIQKKEKNKFILQ